MFNTDTLRTPRSKVNFLIGCYAVAVLAKLWFTLAFNMRAGADAHADDLLFMNLADSLVRGEWLGEYNRHTLAKGPFFSMWIALCFYANIPLLVSYQLFHMSASGLLVRALRPLLASAWTRFALFALLIVEPSTYAVGAGWVVRMGVYVPLTMICVACLIGMLTRVNAHARTFAGWSIGFGIALALFWITREEGIWIIPGYIFTAICCIYALRKNRRALRTRSPFLLIPLVILGLGLFTLCSINYMHYGVFNSVEFKSKAFKRANGALMRVTHKEWNQYANVPKEVRLRVYEVSPAFAELEHRFEGPLGESWGKGAETWLDEGTPSPEDIRGGFFVWALRQAVTAAGYHDSATNARDFYTRLADEINAACDDGRLECGAESNSLRPPWRSQYSRLLVATFFKGSTMLATLEEVDVLALPSSGSHETARLFEDLGRSRLNAFTKAPDYPAKLYHQAQLNRARAVFLARMNSVFKTINPFLVVIAGMAFIFALGLDLRARTLSPAALIGALLLGLTVVRLMFLTYISVTSFEAMKIRYLLPLYPLLYLFCFVSLHYLWSNIVASREARRDSGAATESE